MFHPTWVETLESGSFPSNTQTAGSGGTGSWNAFGGVSLGSLSSATLTDGQKLTVEVTKTGLGVAVPVLAVQIEYTLT